MKSLKALGGVAALTLVSTMAQAEITGNIGIASEYIFRGLPSSGNGAAVSGGLDWSNDKFYAGTWMSNIGNNTTGNEVDVYAGVAMNGFDFGAIGYIYPGDGRQAFGCPGTNAACAATGAAARQFEVYGGYTKGPFSGYVWYNMGSYAESEDDFVYVEGNLTGALGNGIDLTVHWGYTIFTGEDYDQGTGVNGGEDDRADYAVTLNYGGFWMGVSGILDNDYGSVSQGQLQRPRANIGYTWNFDKLPTPSFRF